MSVNNTLKIIACELQCICLLILFSHFQCPFGIYGQHFSMPHELQGVKSLVSLEHHKSSPGGAGYLCMRGLNVEWSVPWFLNLIHSKCIFRCFLISGCCLLASPSWGMSVTPTVSTHSDMGTPEFTRLFTWRHWQSSGQAGEEMGT